MTLKTILLSLENKSSNDWFEPLLEHFIKKNSFKSVQFLLEKTIFDSPDRKNILNNYLFDSFIYKAPTYKMFKLLYDHLEKSGWFKEDCDKNIYEFKDWSQLQKDIIIDKTIDYTFFYNKHEFLSGLIKDFGKENILHRAFSEQLNKKNYYNFDSLNKRFPDFFAQFMDKNHSREKKEVSEPIKVIYKRSEQTYKIEKILQLTQFKYNKFQGDDKYDDLIKPYITKEIFISLVSHFIKKKKNKLFDRFFSKMQQSEFKFEPNEIKNSEWLGVFGKFSSPFKTNFKSCITFHNTASSIIFSADPFDNVDSIVYDNDRLKYRMLEYLVIQAISHNKLGYLKKIISTFELKEVLFSDEIFRAYVKTNLSQDMEDFFQAEVLKKWTMKDIATKMNYYSLNRKVMKFFNETPELLMEYSKYLNTETKKQFTLDLFNKSLPSKYSGKLVKI